MSIDIPLKFETHFDPDLFAEGVSFNIVRLLADVDFKTKDGWSLKYEAIIDTGSPINIIPKIIWTETIYRFIQSKQFSLDGIGPVSVPGYLGEVTIRISSGKISSAAFNIKAFLVDSDSVPLIFGFEDILSAGILYSNYPQNSAYITL